MVTYTPNKGYGYPAHGAEVNNWDAFTNAIFTNIDLNVAGQNTVTVSTGVSTYTLAQGDSGTAQYLQQKVTGTLGSNSQLVFPSTDAGGAFLGIWVISNEATGSFTLTAITTSSTNSGIAIAAGGRSLVVSDGTNIWQANNNTVAKVYTYLGNPNGNVAATVATANAGVTDIVWDGTNRVMWMPMITSVATSAVYTSVAPLPTPQGYLTAVSNTPIITSNQTVGTIFYTPFKGGWMTLPSTGGTSYFPYNFSQQSMSLSALGANNIYDAYIAYLSSVGVFGGFSPSWTVGGGSITAGAGARGTGAGSAQISRGSAGFYVNTNAMSLSNGGTTYSVAAGAAMFVGSVYTASAGATTCHLSYGQSRVWGISNAFNKSQVVLRIGDSSTSWTTTSTGAWTYANANSSNSGTFFDCLGEERPSAEFSQNYNPPYIGMSNKQLQNGIGYNSTSGVGFTPWTGDYVAAGANSAILNVAKYEGVPAMGINNLYELEKNQQFTTFGNFAGVPGTEAYNLMTIRWNA